MGKYRFGRLSRVTVCSAMMGLGICGCGADTRPGGKDLVEKLPLSPEAPVTLDAMADWRAVDVVRRFFRENGKGSCDASIVRYGDRGMSYVAEGEGDSRKIVQALAKDCEAPDAEADTRGNGTLCQTVLSVVLTGERYELRIGIDGAGGFCMGKSQFRWKGPNLARVLTEILQRESILKGEGGEGLEEALRRAATWGVWEPPATGRQAARPPATARAGAADWTRAAGETTSAEARRLEAELLLDPWKPPPGWPYRERHDVVEDLAVLGELAVPALVKGLESPSKDVREHAVTGLWLIGPPARAAAGALAERVEKDLDKGVALLAARAIGKVGAPPPEAIPALVEALEKQGDCTTEDLRDAMVTLGRKAVPVYLRLMESGEKNRRSRAIEALGRIGPRAEDAIDALVRKLVTKDETYSSSAAGALCKIGTKAIPALLKAAEADHSVKWHVTGALGGMGATAVKPLLKALKGDSSAVREVAAEAIGAIDPPAEDAVPELLKALVDPSGDVRANAVKSIGKIAPATAVPALLNALKDTNDAVRWEAVDALTKSERRDKGIIDVYIRMLDDRSENVRSSAAIALWKIGPEAKGAVPVLLRMAAKDTEHVQFWVNMALMAIRRE